MSFPDPHHDHHHCTEELLERAERMCTRRGAKLTAQRREVLACVSRSHAAVGAYEVIDRMAEQGPRPAPITVYRALDFLEAHGLVHKVESRNSYVACSHAHEGEPAALLICEKCGTVAELEAPEAFATLRSGASGQHFRPRRMIVEMPGQCRLCDGNA